MRHSEVLPHGNVRLSKGVSSALFPEYGANQNYVAKVLGEEKEEPEMGARWVSAQEEMWASVDPHPNQKSSADD